jgi:trk system potassium uptake protein TrkH
VVALAAMAGTLWLSTAGLGRLVALRHRAGISGLLRLEAAVVMALVAIAFARAWVLVEMLRDAGTPAALAQAARVYSGGFVVLAAASATALDRSDGFAARLLTWSERPMLLLAGGFAGLIAVSTMLLSLPISVASITDISIVDSLFTATSAACVTGLSVNDVGATYTNFGELVILLTIQLGGLGIMTLAALLLTAAKDAGLEQQSLYCAMLEARHPGELRSMMRTIVATTLAIELGGALLLALAFRHDPNLGDRSLLWMALFHSVSAFCNAGFALWSGNLAPFTESPFTQLVIAALIVLGGLGFPVMRELWRRERARIARTVHPALPRPHRLSLQSRVVLASSAALLVVGAWLIGVLEHSQSLAKLGLGDEIVNAVFASVTSRTAGFNTVDFGAMRDATLLVVMLLMFIGGSPGSCAGGIKTTTFATLVATMRAELRGRDPQLFGRALPAATVRRAVAVTALSAAIVFVVAVILSLLEPQPLSRLLFETVSAFGTVGLSTGITASLSIPSKLVLVVAMFLGRVGPLTVALAVGDGAARPRHRLASEALPIG